MFLGKLAIIAFAVTIATVVYARDQGSVAGIIKANLSERYPGARIELTSPVGWIAGAPAGAIGKVNLIDEDARGDIQFSVESRSAGQATRIFRGWTSYAAYLPAKVATRRILPGEALNPELFSDQYVNIVTGQGREFRDLILPQSMSVVGLQSRQTILAGQFLVSSAVERVPDVRRGDEIQIRLVSGALTLSALGTAEEPGYLNGRVRVMTNKTKRELVGRLLRGGIVEVKL